MRITELIKTKQTLSFEFFPPKESSQEAILFETVERLAPLKPDFVSITYGAGGSTREKTFDWSKALKDKHKLLTMMHLTCMGNTPESILSVCEKMSEAGLTALFALRGDKPADANELPCAFAHASDLVSFVKKHYPTFEIGVAGYPEKHTEANNMAADIANLKKKVDAGADFIITQLFFDNSVFYRFAETAQKNGINVPIIAGIMPVVSQSQVLRFTQMCGVRVPTALTERLDQDPDNAKASGLEHAMKQVADLKANGAAGIHYYTLNRYNSVYEIIKTQETL